MSAQSTGYFLCDVTMGLIAGVLYFLHPAAAIAFTSFLAARSFKP
jgi:hypothetical protein